MDTPQGGKFVLSTCHYYKEYVALKARPQGMKPFKRNAEGQFLMHSMELYCRAVDDQGRMCDYTKHFSGGPALEGHLQSRAHKLRVYKPAFGQTFTSESKAKDANWYKRVMIRHNKLVAGLPVDADEDSDDDVIPLRIQPPAPPPQRNYTETALFLVGTRDEQARKRQMSAGGGHTWSPHRDSANALGNNRMATPGSVYRTRGAAATTLQPPPTQVNTPIPSTVPNVGHTRTAAQIEQERVEREATSVFRCGIAYATAQPPPVPNASRPGSQGLGNAARASDPEGAAREARRLAFLAKKGYRADGNKRL